MISRFSYNWKEGAVFVLAQGWVCPPTLWKQGVVGAGHNEARLSSLLAYPDRAPSGQSELDY